jgi:uncharacterized membrane protein YphA (DoxX/SURF4 family)
MKPNTRLWTAQVVLAAMFLFAGGMKLVMPTEVLAQQAHLPGLFLKFIGVCETLGAIGLIVPWLTNIRRELTPIAATGLIIIMIGATVISAVQGPIATAVPPAIIGLLAFYVVRGRRESAAQPVRVHQSSPSLQRAA